MNTIRMVEEILLALGEVLAVFLFVKRKTGGKMIAVEKEHPYREAPPKMFTEAEVSYMLKRERFAAAQAVRVVFFVAFALGGLFTFLAIMALAKWFGH